MILQAGGKDDHRVLALDARTGATAWSSKGVERTSQASAVVADLGNVRQVVAHQVRVAEAQASGLVGLRLADGAVLWSTVLEKNVSLETPVVLPGDRLLLLTWNDAHVFSLERQGESITPRRVWSSLDLLADVSPPVYHDGHLYGFGGDNLTCLEAATGKKLWEYATDNYVNGTPAVDGGGGERVVFGGCDAVLHVVDGASGAALERIELGEACHVAGSVALAGGRAYFGHYGNAFVCVDLESRETLWRVTDPDQAFFSSPAVAPERVVFGGRNKRVHCAERATGAATSATNSRQR